jgi:hypothetical protein
VPTAQQTRTKALPDCFARLPALVKHHQTLPLLLNKIVQEVPRLLGSETVAKL